VFHHGALKLVFGSTSIQGTLFCGPASGHDDITCTSGQVLDQFAISGQTVGTGPIEPPVALALDDVRPDPARATFTLRYALLDAGDARLELLDVAGRSVHRFALEQAGPGGHEAVMRAPSGLRPGVYWLRLTQSGRSVRRSVVLIP
jgi:hypothetical protein